MRYVKARLEKYSRELAYRIFVTDSLKAVVENTHYITTFDGIIPYGVSVKRRWIDIMNGVKPKEKEKPKEDTRTCEEVVSDIWKNARIGKRKK